MTEPRFFKQATAEGNSGEFKRCLPMGVQTTYKTMAPAIATAELLRIKPLLGEPLFETAADYYDANGTSGESDVKNALVELLQMTVVRLACWDSFAQLAVMMTDDGIQNNKGEKRAYRYETDALRESLRRQGYEYLNKVLEHCTTHIADLPEFAQSPYYTTRQDSLIRSMSDYERFVSLRGDFCVFAKLREWIDQAEQMELEYRIGTSMVARLKERRTADSIILRCAMAFIAHWSMAEAAPFLNMEHTAQGLVIVSEESGGSTSSGKSEKQPTSQQIDTYAAHHRQAAERYIGQLVTYCKRNIDTYPEIAEIGTESDTEHGPDIIDNQGKKTFLVI